MHMAVSHLTDFYRSERASHKHSLYVKCGEMKLSKSDTLVSVLHICSVGNEAVALDSSSLFHRVLVMSE